MRTIRTLRADDADRLAELLRAAWGSTRMASRGRLLAITELPGFVAERGGEWLGYAAYELRDGELEIAALESIAPGSGVGGALLASCVELALEAGARRLWLVTTNDNTCALRFYQRRGLVLAAIHLDAVNEARRHLKPEIGELGQDGIPIRDEIELELPRTEWAAFVERYTWPPS